MKEKEITFSEITDRIADKIDDEFKSASDREKIRITSKRLVSEIKELILGEEKYRKIKIAGLANFVIVQSKGGTYKLKGKTFVVKPHKKLVVKVSRSFQKDILDKIR